MTGKPKGKPKTRPSTEEQATIASMAASGLSQTKIAKHIGRSRHLVRNTLAEPEIQRTVKDERQELAVMYRGKARDILVSINNKDISEASLQQKAVSTGILLDKSLLLSGEATSINVNVLMDVVEAIRARQQGRVELPTQSARSAPA